MHTKRLRTPRFIATVAALVWIALILSACDAKLQEVSDDVSWFHVRVPASWQTQVEPNSLLIYTADKLPESEDEAFRNLSVVVLRSDVESSTPVAEQLTEMVDARARAREWSGVEVSEPETATVGGRDGQSVTVTATDAKGRPFAGRISLVRTNGREALIVALSPQERWDEDEAAVDELYSEWYWHQPVKNEPDTEAQDTQ